MAYRILPRTCLAAALAASAAFPALAQDQEERDRGFIAGLIEDNLSAPGLSVRVDGFSGALSSRASLERLQVSDDEGVWLTLEDVVLDWNRSALLRGRLEVEDLSAGLISVARAPLPAEGVEALPDAGASGFALPDLPVSVNVERLHADRIELGASLLGQALALSLDASARLADGSGAVTIEAQRLDGTTGTFSIAASYEADTQALSIDLDIAEAEGGIAATLLQLPGAPAIELTVTGAGPLDAFAADIGVAADGQERLGGSVTLMGVEDGRRIGVDVAGDVTSLFAPRYQPFFGDDVALRAQVLQRDDGGIELEDLAVETRALTLAGRARIGADGWPTLLDVTGTLASADGTPVLLPTATASTLRRADLTIAHDASVSDEIRLQLRAVEYGTPTLMLGDATLTVSGIVARQDGTVTGAEAAIEAALNQLGFADPAIAAAVGGRIGLSTDLAWVPGAPVALTDLRLSGPDYALTGTVAIDATDPEGPLTVRPDLAVTAEDLARFAAVAGLDGLAGSGDVTLAGDYAPLAGTFDVTLDAVARDLALGIEQADGLLSGETRLAVAARRDAEGTYLDRLDLANPQLDVSGTAAIVAEDAPSRDGGAVSAATLRARIADGTVIDPRLDGEVTLAADVTQDAAGVWQGTIDAAAPHGVTVTADGVLTGPSPDLTFAASVPDVSAYVAQVPGALSLDGRASAANGIWSLDAQASGPWGLEANVSGPVTGPEPTIAFDAALPEIAAPVPALEAYPSLTGAVSLAGTVRQRGGAWSVTTEVDAPSGIALAVDGALTPAVEVDVTATIPDLRGLVPQLEAYEALDGTVTLNGTVAQRDGAFVVTTDVAGPSGIVAQVAGEVAPDLDLDVTATVPDLQGLVPQVSGIAGLDGALSLDGSVAQRDGAFVVDATAAAPSGVTLGARGPVTGPDLRIEFAGTVPMVEDFAPVVEGRLDVDGVLARQGEDFAADVTARGPYGAVVTAQSVLTAQPLSVDFTADVPDLSPLAPVPGGLSVAGNATLIEDGVRVEVAGTGPYDATIDAEVTLVDGVPTVDAQGRIPDAGQLAPQLSGPVDYDVSVVQRDGQVTIDATVDGAQALQASVQGVATGPEADVDVSLRVGDVANFVTVSGISGPLEASGRAFQQGGNWNVDIDASGPLGATLDAQGVVTGPSPQASFTLAVPNIGPLVPEISGPLRVEGTASQQPGGAYAIDIDLDGPAGTQAAVAGTVGAGGQLDLDVNGSAPLGLANPFLEPNRIAGVAQFDIALNGAPGLDAVTGTITTSDAALSLPALRNGLETIQARITLGGGRAQVDVTASPESGGQLQVTGPVTLSAPFDADLAATFDIALEDPRLYTTDVAGEIRITGPLTGGATIAGVVNVDETEISVPSSGLTAVGPLPDIRHLGATRPVRRTLERAGQALDPEAARAAEGGGGGGGGPVYGLNVRVNAPGRIFVRGRGLDAELGGSLTITGTTANPVTAGGFELIRGRIDVLEQRFALDEGRIDFAGDFVPNIRLVATTETDTITASIVVEGPADALEVRFESTPEVPQEEIVAQIFFGRDLSELSPIQALQLANSVATLAGRGQGGLLDNLRGSTGLDDLDVTTDDEGNVALRAGKYVSDNVYTDVQVNQNGEAEISLNLDVSPNLTVRGSAGATGGSSLGIFYERDY